MPKFSQYKSFTRQVTVKLSDNETLTIHYTPARVSGERWDNFTSGNKDFDDTALLASVVTGWDWTDDKDKAIPATAEFLKENVCVGDRLSMITAIVNDVFPTRNPQVA